MHPEAYELLSMLMRYVFVALGLLILLRAGRQMMRDARERKKELKKLPDAGRIGEVVDLETGKHYPLPREGMIGSSSACDIRLRRRGVKRRHALFEFAEGKGVRIKPCYGRKVWVEGVPIKATAYALHGTKITLNQANIRIRLFAGLNVPHPAAFAATLPEKEADAIRTDVEMPRPFERMIDPDGGMEDGMPQPFENRIPDWQGMAENDRPMPPPAYVPQQVWQGQYDPGMPPPEPVPPATQPRPGFDAQGIPLPAQPLEEDDEAVPYYSPVERPRRSNRR